MNIAEFLENAKGYAHLVKEGRLLKDVQELKMFEKIMLSVFVVDKRSRQICRSTNDTIIVIHLPGD